MLDERDLQVLQQLFLQSEERMNVRMDTRIAESEARMTKLIEESEARTTKRIEESEARMRELIEETSSRTYAYIQTAIEPKIKLLAEGHQLLLETLVSRDEFEQMKDEMDMGKRIIVSLAHDVRELKAH